MEERTLICEFCNKKFKTRATNAKYCSRECGAAALKKLQKDLKNLQKRSLDDELAELKAYNEKHGTHLSYGQFKALPGVK